MKTIINTTLLLLATLSGMAQNVSYNFGTSASSLSSGTSTTFLPAVASGTTQVKIGNGGSFNLETSGSGNTKLGSGSLLRMTASSNSTVNKVSLYDFTGDRAFYSKFSFLLGNSSAQALSTSGNWVYAFGNGSSFSNSSDYSNNDIFGALQFTIGSNGAITTKYRSNGSWITLSSFTFKQGNVYTIEVFANNLNGSSNTVNYTYKGLAETIADDRFDVYVNGILIIDDARRNGMSTSANIDSWMFTGESSTSNNSNLFLDDVFYSSTIDTAYNTELNYYAKTSGALNLLTSWTTNMDGTGDATPANFSTSSIYYHVKNTTNAGITGNLSISGTNSKIILGDSVNAISLTVPETYTINATIDVLKNANLIINNATQPVLGNIYTGSTINYKKIKGAGIPSGTYCKLIVSDSAGVVAGGDITVNTTLDLSLGSFNLNGKTLTLNGRVTGSGKLIGSSTSNLIVNGSNKFDTVLFSQDIQGSTNRLNNLTINRGASISDGTFNLGNTVEVGNTVTLVNGTLHTQNNLVLISTATQTASIAAIPASADILGNVTVQRYIPSVVRRYRMLSPNTSSFTYNDLKDDMFISGSGGATNGFDFASGNQTTAYTYQESTTGGRGWKAVTHINQTLDQGKGTLVFVRGDRTLPAPQWYTAPYVAQNALTADFTGPVNKGNISPAITYTSTGDPTSDGWNLIGNPYPSSINWNLVSKSNLNGFIYTLDPATNAYVANDGSTPVASGQAFFVQANAISPSVTFTENCKTSSTPAAYFKAAYTNRFTIRMVRDSINSDVAWLRFVNGASMTYNSNEDAIKFTNSGINMGFKVPTNPTNVQLNTVPPLTNIADTFVLFSNAAANNYYLEFSQLQNIPATKAILLHDLFTNTITDIRSTQQYNFSITSNAASQGNRFLLVIINQNALPVNLVSFHVIKAGNDANVLWSTAGETNNDRFIIERSFDNSIFEPTGVVKGAGNYSGLFHYTFSDKEAINYAKQHGAEMIYYRVKQVDFSGETSISATVVLQIENTLVTPLLAVYPNPATSQITIINADSKPITIADISGKPVKSITAETGTVQVDISDLSGGIYFIKAANGASLKLLVN